MSKTLFTTALLICITVNMAVAQWNGATTNTTGDLYREGAVGIGTTTTPAAKLELNFFNGSGQIPQYGLLLNTNSFGTGSNANNSYYLKTLDQGNGAVTFIVKGNGNVGIGNANPATMLHINNGANYGSILLGDNSNGGVAITKEPDNRLAIWNNGMYGQSQAERFTILQNGNVGIGTNNPGSFKLAVEGRIAARGVKVTNTSFADYVFDPGYQLRPLSSLSNYINQNKHLPGIPSAKEVEKEGGFELGEMNVKLLEKIEELTLYVIELKKENEQMKEKIEKLEARK